MRVTDDMVERYLADQTENGDPMVLDLSSHPARVVCGCRSDEDAEMIARALNKGGEMSKPIYEYRIAMTRYGARSLRHGGKGYPRVGAASEAQARRFLKGETDEGFLSWIERREVTPWEKIS
jgi:hypothetical protein